MRAHTEGGTGGGQRASTNARGWAGKKGATQTSWAGGENHMGCSICQHNICWKFFKVECPAYMTIPPTVLYLYCTVKRLLQRCSPDYCAAKSNHTYQRCPLAPEAMFAQLLCLPARKPRAFVLARWLPLVPPSVCPHLHVHRSRHVPTCACMLSQIT